MSVITAPNLNWVLDELVQGYVTLLGDADSGMGEPDGGTGMAVQMTRLETFLSDFSMGVDFEQDCGRAILALQDRMSAVARYGEFVRTTIANLNRHLRRFGGSNYSDLDTYLTYCNTGGGGTWAALQDYRWRSIYNAIKGGSNYPQIYNLYFEVLQGSTYANGIRKWVVTGAGTGTPTAGFDIDSTKYAGGIPCLKVSSFGGSSDTVTITGTFFDPATKTTETAKTATFTVTGNGRFYRVAGTAAANALLISLTTIAAGNNITAGTIYAEAERPAFRSGTCGADTVSNTTAGLDDSASAVNDYYNGLEVKTNADLYTARTISDYDGTTKVVTVSSAWATNPTASTSLFRVLRKLIA